MPLAATDSAADSDFRQDEQDYYHRRASVWLLKVILYNPV